MCFGCSNEPSHRDGYFKYPQHMFWLRNKKIYFNTLIWRPGRSDIMLILPGKLSLSVCLVLSMSLAIASGPSLILGPPPLPAIGDIAAYKVLKHLGVVPFLS